MNEDGIHDLIGAIYEAPLDPRQWNIVVERLRAATRSRQGHIYAGAIHSTLEDFTSPSHFLGYDNDTHSLADLESFGRHMRDSTLNDPHRLRFNPALLLKKAFFTWEVMPLDDYKHSAFYNEFGRPMDSFCGLVAVTTGRGGDIINLAFYRSERDPLFDPGDKRLLGVFLPHIWRSLKFHERLQTVGAETSILQGSIDALTSAIVLLDRRGKVIFLNQAAERLLERCQELYLRRDRLCTVCHADTLKLDQLVKSTTDGNGQRPLGGAVTIERSSGLPALQVTSAPVPLDYRSTFLNGPVAMLVIHDPNAEAPVPHEIVSTMFGLTPAETRLLLALSSGQTLKQYGDESRVTQNTARTHLKSVFAKTKTAKQSDLVRLMSGLQHSMTFPEPQLN